MSKKVSRVSQIKVNNGKQGRSVSRLDTKQQYRPEQKPKLTEEQMAKGQKLDNNALDNLILN